MPTSYRSKGPWLSRFAIRSLAIAWGLLIFWSLGLLVDDIGAIPGPDYQKIEQRYLDTQLVKQRQALDQQIEETNGTITRLQEEQRLIGESSESLQQTIDQLMGLQRSNSKNSTNSRQTSKSAGDLDNQVILAKSLNRFLQNQETDQKLNQSIAQSVEQKRKLTDQRSQIDQQLDQQRQPAKVEFERLSRQHRLKLAGFQLLVLIPLLLLAAWLLAKNRGSIYYPLILAFAIASLVKVMLIIGQYFPERWVQYSLAAVSLVIIARLLVYLIRSVTFPKASSLAQQYREAYESFLCPVCEYTTWKVTRGENWSTRAVEGSSG
jgi:hypothetical protein